MHVDGHEHTQEALGNSDAEDTRQQESSKDNDCGGHLEANDDAGNHGNAIEGEENNCNDAGDEDGDEEDEDDEDDDGEDDDDDDDNDDDDDDDDDDDEDGDDDEERTFAESDIPESLRNLLSGDPTAVQRLGALMGGLSTRLRSIMKSLKQRQDPSLHLIALQDLAELLSVSTEDMLSGCFGTDAFAKELVDLLRGEDPICGGNPEIMLLACRCISNMMEAIPASTGVLVYNGVVPALCAKLMEIEYIDLAELALSTLGPISLEYPSSIVRDCGLSAVLMFLDFFTVSAQRAALAISANCCKVMRSDMFDAVKEVMPTLERVLGYSDQKVLESTCLCLARLTENFSTNTEQLESLLNKDLLRQLCDILSPLSNVTISDRLFTQLVSMLAIAARASPKLTMMLLELGIMELVYQILTGLPPPPQNDVAAPPSAAIASAVGRSGDQLKSILSLASALLPSLPTAESGENKDTKSEQQQQQQQQEKQTEDMGSTEDKRAEILRNAPEISRRVCELMLPTLVEVYSATTKRHVRQRIITVLLKLVHFSQPDTLTHILKDTPITGLIAAVLAHAEQSMITVMAIQLAELLLTVYCASFEREGVLQDIRGLIDMESAESCDNRQLHDASVNDDAQAQDSGEKETGGTNEAEEDNAEEDAGAEGSSETLDPMRAALSSNIQLLERLGSRLRGALDDLLGNGQETCGALVSTLTRGNDARVNIYKPFCIMSLANNVLAQIAGYFQPSTHGISSFELTKSGIIDALLHSGHDTGIDKGSTPLATDAHNATAAAAAAVNADHETAHTIFSVLVKRLQESLGRSEAFEVLSDRYSSLDDHGNLAATLGKQIRLKLVPEDGLDAPKAYTNLVVSIHAVAPLRTLDEYLAPRVLRQRSRFHRRHHEHALTRREGRLEDAIATIAAATGISQDEAVASMQQEDGADASQNDDRPSQVIEYVFFRSTLQPPPPERPTRDERTLSYRLDGVDVDLAETLDDKHACTPILSLLRCLSQLSRRVEDGFFNNTDHRVVISSSVSAEFVNGKLTAKLRRQLGQPLVVISNIIPGWWMTLAREYPFLFPFEVRHLLLKSASFGYSRTVHRWLEELRANRREGRQLEQGTVGRIQRQKVRISRDRLLESAVKVLRLYGTADAILEVEYFEEVGTGLGPTLEFYANVSKECCRKVHRLWRDADPNGDSEYVVLPHGLFPRPIHPDHLDTSQGRATLFYFRFMGQFVARALIDSRIIDLPLSPLICEYATRHLPFLTSTRTSKQIDPSLASSLLVLHKFAQRKTDLYRRKDETMATELAELNAAVQDLCLDFTLPGYPDVLLKSEGQDIPVTIYNVDEYLRLVLDFSIGTGVAAQIRAFRSGFDKVFPMEDLRCFEPAELALLLGGGAEDWSYETLTETLRADHGYTMNSATVRNLIELMTEFDTDERRLFLQFITGSPRLPIGGFKSLQPPFTIVRKPSEHPLAANDYLPSVMTCVNYLKMPEYTEKQVMKLRILQAIQEGQGSFHLS
ncbi:hypothetical protein THASP1DRAFT_18424 [Thamnocephalis sphaerospora]|uniref:HECT-type E3 ubiquitin transferase n=1 Tax=Thamnocephalis sphaerospora TaxID=78915 RepID=A0A4P9XL33_9FUNG|nr:hypothetical protein THASP1DRAFT_18424 [Thamnocephalis sphaerospora]|eukprot:RKP06495.1 hypothetical protein THASP1DRAFT_18424 [Thamnocephalis sphaerospora]